jgi:hypothetical protein
VVLCALALTPAPGSRAASADEQAQRVIARWLTDPPDGIIEISLAPDGTYQGRIIGGNTPNRTDASNPDPAKRSATLLGQTLKLRGYLGVSLLGRTQVWTRYTGASLVLPKVTHQERGTGR